MRIGIDLGGTSVKAALCADDGAILIKQSVPTRTGDPDGLREDMKQLALALCEAGGVQPDEVESIGIGVPGTYDKVSCTLKVGTNLGMNDVCFSQAFPAGVCLRGADGQRCELRGSRRGDRRRGEEYQKYAHGTLGTGVGGGIVIDGKLYTGCNNMAGEIGHIVIRKGGEPCGCGRRGCLEAYASASSLVKFAHRAMDAGRESSLRENGPDLNAKHICDAVDAGDALACELFEEYCDNLACGLASLINIFQPECIVLGGGLAGYGEKLLRPLRERIERETFRGDRNTVLTAASLGNDAGLVGAAML